MGLRGAVIRAERKVAAARKDLDSIRAFWMKELMEYDRESLALKRRVI